MVQKKSVDDSYDRFSADVKAGRIGCFYIFHGEERYLLERSLGDLRRRVCPEGLDGFNYKRFEGKSLNPVDLDETINTLPVFADRTLIEIHDYDVFKGKKKIDADEDDQGETEAEKKSNAADSGEKQQLAKIFSDLPDFVCIVIVYDTIPYKTDSRLKLDKEILSYAQVVHFCIQEQSKLTRWIARHFESSGKHISKADAEYLALITDGYMAALVGEIEKVSAFSDGEIISRADIDAVVTPVLAAFVYKLTDALLERKHATAMSILDDLFQLR